MDPFDKEFEAHLQRIRDAGVSTEQRIELTCSSVPGTTLRMSKIKIPALGIKIYDTPGLMTEGQHFALVSQFRLLKTFGRSHDMSHLGVHLEPRKSLWIGGVIRIDSFAVW